MCAKVSFRVQPESAATNFGTGEARSHVSNFSCFFQVQKIDPSFWQVFPLAQESKRP